MTKKVNVIHADGSGYYEYLPALFIYNDIHFNYLDTLQSTYYKREQIDDMYKSKKYNHRIDKYFVGTAVLQSPFFAYAQIKTHYFTDKYKPDGFSKPYQRSIFYAAIFYLFLGLVFIRKLLETYSVNKWSIFLTQLFILFSTSLFNYTMYDSSYSHVYSFAMISGFILFIRLYMLNDKGKYIFYSLIFLGIITIIRPINVLVVVFIPFFTTDWKLFITKFKQLFIKHQGVLSLGIITYLGLLCIQFYISYLQTGNPFNYNYGDEKFNFLQSHISDFLWSYRKGFFLWSPWWFLTFLFGTIFWIKEKKYYHLFTFFIAFIIVTYVFSSWDAWSYGGSFGARPMVDFYGAFSLIAIPIFRFGKGIIKWIYIIFSIPLSIVSMTQTFQYQEAIICWDCMTKDKYWQVFLNTDKKYAWYFWKRKIYVGNLKSRNLLLKHVTLSPAKFHKIENIKIPPIDSLAQYGRLSFDLNREADDEHIAIRMYDSLGNKLSYQFQTLFYWQKNNQVVYTFLLSKDKLKVKDIGITFCDIKSPLIVKNMVFSTYYSTKQVK